MRPSLNISAASGASSACMALSLLAIPPGVTRNLPGL
jgi:hypothetical protein